jgi:hypothetical protein
MALTGAADSRIAGHVADGVKVYGEYYGFETHAGGGKGGFYAGVPCPDDRDVTGSRYKIHSGLSFQHILPAYFSLCLRQLQQKS